MENTMTKQIDKLYEKTKNYTRAVEDYNYFWYFVNVKYKNVVNDEISIYDCMTEEENKELIQLEYRLGICEGALIEAVLKT